MNYLTLKREPATQLGSVVETKEFKVHVGNGTISYGRLLRALKMVGVRVIDERGTEITTNKHNDRVDSTSSKRNADNAHDSRSPAPRLAIVSV